MVRGANDADWALTDEFTTYLEETGLEPFSVIIDGQSSRSAVTNAIDEITNYAGP